MSLDKIKSWINSHQTDNSIPQVTADSVEHNKNIFDDNETSYSKYNQNWDNNWIDVNVTSNKFLFSNSDFVTYKTANGTTISVKDNSDVVIKQNMETGEIVVIGASAEEINLAQGDNLTLVESTAKKINAKNGDASIKVEGSHTSVGSITGGKGSQRVIVSSGAKVEEINTGDDDDVVIVNNSQVGKVETGKGNDGVISDNSTITNDINLGKGDDYILLSESTANGQVISGEGNDTVESQGSKFGGKINLNSTDSDITTVNLSDSSINCDIDAYSGNANINIENNSTLSENKSIITGYGNYSIRVDNSNLDGNLVASGFEGNSSYESFKLSLNNSSFGNVSGLRNDDSTEFNLTNSRTTGAENVSNSVRKVVSLDTSEGSEFEDYKILKPDSNNTRKIYSVKISDTQTMIVSEDDWREKYINNYQLIDEITQNIYTLPDGTIICLNQDGEVYINASGEIVINGADKAEIFSNSAQNSNKITVINSDILSHENLAGNVEYRNSNVGTITVSNTNYANIAFIDKCKIGDITSNNSNLNISLLNNSRIVNLQSSGTGTLNINSDVGEISKIQTSEADISGNFKNTKIGTIITKNGSVYIEANKSEISTINNSNNNGETKLSFNDVTLSEIISNSKSNINLNNCSVTSKIKTSSNDDIITVTDSQVKNLETKQGNDDIKLKSSKLEKIISSEITNTTVEGTNIEQAIIQGDIAIYKSDIDFFSGYGNIAVKSSDIGNLNVYGYQSNLDIVDSFIKNESSYYISSVHTDNFGYELSYGLSDETYINPVKFKVDEISVRDMKNVYAIFGDTSEDDINNAMTEYDYMNLSASDKEEIMQLIKDDPKNPVVIIYGLISEMQGVFITLENALNDTQKSGGRLPVTAIINLINNNLTANEIKSKKEMFQKAVKSGNFESLLSAYSILTDEISASEAISEYNSAINYASTLSVDDIGNVLKTLSFIGNLMEYNITEQDGIIKNIIAYANMYFDIGTNRKEAEAYVQTFKEDINKLFEKYNNSELSKEEFVLEYKRLTGSAFIEKNVSTILDNARNNEVFKNIAQDKIEDYQQTQQQIFQIGEYTITIIAGSIVTLSSGGAAGPAIYAALSAAGKMGVALTATTVSFLTKAAIEAAERQTNSIVSDNLSAEEIATSAALMYAGCLCGQFGNAVGDYIRGSAPEFLSQFITSKQMINIISKASAKTFEIGADTAASVASTALITGSGEWNEEFLQNLQSEFIGVIQSTITNQYFSAHPEIQTKAELYTLRKEFENISVEEANTRILRHFGLGFINASDLTSDDIDTIVLLKAVNDLCDKSLREHNIDSSALKFEEKTQNIRMYDIEELVNKLVEGGKIKSSDYNNMKSDLISFQDSGIDIYKLTSFSNFNSETVENMKFILNTKHGDLVIDRLNRLILNNNNLKIQASFVKSLEFARQIIDFKIDGINEYQISALAKFFASPETKAYSIDSMKSICSIEAEFAKMLQDIDLSNINNIYDNFIGLVRENLMSEAGLTKKSGLGIATQQILNDLHYEIAAIAKNYYINNNDVNALDAIKNWVNADKACEHYQGKMLQDPSRFSQCADDAKFSGIEFKYGTIEEYTESILKCKSKVEELSLNSDKDLIGSRITGDIKYEYYFLPNNDDSSSGSVIIFENGKISTIVPKQSYSEFLRKFN